jgi:hypothetical protein
MRISSLTPIFMLAGCGTSGAQNVVAAAPEADRIECAAAGEIFARDCIVDQDASTITVRRSDGGFRRFDRDESGALRSADGAEEGSSQPMPDGRVEISIDGETYRLPIK